MSEHWERDPTHVNIVTFLRQSNLIEDEYSDAALVDAWDAWKYARRWTHDPDGTAPVTGVHSRLMVTLWPEIAGKLRDCGVRVGGRICPPANEVPGLLQRLLASPPFPDAGAIREWHVAFEKIHPFRDGNGRTGRIIMNCQRLRAGLPILVIPANERHEYYEWFR